MKYPDRYKLLKQALYEALGTVSDKSELSLFVWAGGWRVLVEDAGDGCYTAEMRVRNTTFTLLAPCLDGKFDWSRTALIEQRAY